MKAWLFVFATAAFIACTVLAHGQTNHTLHVKNIKGANVGAKLATAMSHCSSNVVIPCILVIDSSLAASPAGSLPALCSHCYLQDWRIGIPKAVTVDANSYTSFTAACAYAAMKNAVLVVSRTYTGLPSQSCGANIQIRAGVLRPASGQTLTLTAMVDAPMQQVFDTSAGGSVVLSNTPVVFPEWFGAVGDGVASDAAAVQAAISSTSGHVRLTKIYKITSQLFILAAQAGLLIDGPGKLVTGATLAPYTPLVGVGDNSVIVVYQAPSVTVADITIDQTGLGTAAGAIEFLQSSNGAVRHTRLINSTLTGIHFYDHVDNATILDNYIAGAAADGIDWHSRSRHAVISGNTVLNTGVVGIEVEGRIGGDDLNLQICYDAVVTNNFIRNEILTNQGILIDWSKNVSVTGNILENVQGIELLGVVGASVAGNTFKDTPNFVEITPEIYTHGVVSSNINISGNSGTLTTYPASPRYDGLFMVDSANNVTVADNTATLNDYSHAPVFFRRGATVSTPQNLLVTGNRTVGGFLTWAANVNAMTLTNNQMGIRHGGAAMTIPTGNLSDIIFTGNVVENMNTLQAANASGTVTNLNISGNVFKALNQSIGIYTPSSATLVRVIINGNKFSRH
jgi:hypothetical protein